MEPVATVIGNVRCRRCGYDLQMLPNDGYCPECGSHISNSERPNTLDYADPEYTRKLALGMLLWLYGTVAGLAVVLLIGFVVVTSPTWTFLGWIELLTNVGLGGLSLYGSWLLTTPDLGVEPGVPDWRARTRIMAVVSFLSGMQPEMGTNAWLDGGLTVLGFSLWLATLVVSLTYLSHLALRLSGSHPGEELRRRCVQLRGLVVMIAFLAGIALVFSVVPGVGYAFIGIAGCTLLPALLLASIGMIRWITLVHAFRAALRQASDTASETWKERPEIAGTEPADG